MKKILILIITIFGILISFCSADNVSVFCDSNGCAPSVVNLGSCTDVSITNIQSDGDFFVGVSICTSNGDSCSTPFNIFNSSDRSFNCDSDGTNYQNGTINFSSSDNVSFVVGGVVGDNSSGGGGGSENTGSVDTGSEVILTSNSYINTLNNSFGLFQYYFFGLVQILPYILLIIGFILLFYFVFNKR